MVYYKNWLETALLREHKPRYDDLQLIQSYSKTREAMIDEFGAMVALKWPSLSKLEIISEVS
jgi:hypothetical protein